MRHPLAWCAWAIAALAVAFIDRNPFLQLAMLMVLINVSLRRRQANTTAWKLGLLLASMPIVFSVVFSRFGHHVLFRLPAIPILGGPWTLEAALFGASTGVALLLVIAVFGILQTRVRSADLIALLPASLYRAGTVFGLALAFAPQTIASLQAISDARKFRGRRSGWRAGPALVVPLLLTTLERALQYGESLDARGYGARRRSRYRNHPWRLGDSLALATAAGSMILMVTRPSAGYNPYLDLAPGLPSPLDFLAIVVLAVPAMFPASSGVKRAADLA